MTKKTKVSQGDFYHEYHGHRIEDLEIVWESLLSSDPSIGSSVTNKQQKSTAIIYLAGDSTMDNKFWILGGPKEPACNGYEHVITPPRAVPDVAYAVNKYAAHADACPVSFKCINTAVEESTLGQRTAGSNSCPSREESVHNAAYKKGICRRIWDWVCCCVGKRESRNQDSAKQYGSKPFSLPQDAFIHEHLRSCDVIVVSAGGNDIALRPRPRTIMAVLWLSRFASKKNIENGTAWGLGYMTERFFKPKFEEYLNHLLSGEQKSQDGQSRRRCALIVPAMLYYLDENKDAQSWANATLKVIGYNSDPTRIHMVIDHVFRSALCRLQLNPQHQQYNTDQDGTDKQCTKIGGIKIAPVAMSTALNGKTSADYVARVEPSAQGGDKLGRLLFDHIHTHYPFE